MKRVFCDKCKNENYNISKLYGEKAIYEVDEHCVSGEIDLCDDCRHELGKIIKEWLNK